MEMNLRRILMLSSILLVLGATLKLPSIVTGSPATTVTIDPLITVKAPNELFNVTLTVAEVNELYFWELNLTFNPLILEAVSYFEGPFLKEALLAQDTDTGAKVQQHCRMGSCRLFTSSASPRTWCFRERNSGLCDV